MSRAWIFQSNPKYYDIDSAVEERAQIAWRVPQHASDIREDDLVVIWRSGKDAGVIGVADVQGPARTTTGFAHERRFAVDPSRTTDEPETRVPVVVRPVRHVPRNRVAAHPALAEHRIIKAPMGTVFPLSETERKALLELIEVEEETPPGDVELPVETFETTPAESDEGRRDETDGSLSTSRAVADRLEERATDSENPQAFEEAIAETFARLGFDAELLGGAGRTDVLLRAPLARSQDYVVIVDGKTSARGVIGDSAVDWVTLRDHAQQHGTDLIALVGPAFQSDRVMTRAEEFGATLISAAELGELCRAHAHQPLGLHTYRHLFVSPLPRLDLIEEERQEMHRRLDIAAGVLRVAQQIGASEGPMGSGDLYWNLRDQIENLERGEVAAMMEALSILGLLIPNEGRVASLGDLGIASGLLASIRTRLD